jgi:hypothetical protein
MYACRHTFASWAIRAGVQLFYLSRVMGTHPLHRSTRPTATSFPDSEEYLRGLLYEYDLATKASSIQASQYRIV